MIEVVRTKGDYYDGAMFMERGEPDLFTDHDAAREAAAVACDVAGITADELELVRFRQRRSWVYVAEQAGVVVKIEPDTDGRLLTKREEQVGFVQELHETGAPVERHLMHPTHISVERAAGNAALYVATATEYLPEAYDQTSDDYRSYGEALLGLHKASERFTGCVPGFQPLDVPWKTYRKLYKLREQEALPQLGEDRFDEDLVTHLGRMLVEAEAHIEELLVLNEAKGCPPALLHTDITPFNARRNAEGRGVFIDLTHCCKGPWAYDFGRPLEWYRFRRSAANVQTLLDGYTAIASWAIDPQMLGLGKRIAHVRYAASPATRLADMALQGCGPNAYLLDESIRRLSGEKYWRSEEDYVAEQTERARID